MGLLFRRKVALPALGIALVLVATWHYVTLYRSFTGARSSLTTANERLSKAGLDLTAADLAATRRDLRSARGDVETARSHLTKDPAIRLFGLISPIGDQIDAAETLLTMAHTLTVIGDGAASAGEKALAVRDRPSSGAPLTRSLLDVLEQTAGEVDRIDAATRSLVELRRDLGDAKLYGPLNTARIRIDEELPRIANYVETARQARGLVSGFLGFEGERRYLVLALNNGELLPGGGLVTAAGIMPIAGGVNGTIDFTDSTRWKEKAEARGVPYIPPPGPLQRHLLRDFTWNLLVSNWSPDFPTWAQQAREFYELVNGPQTIDGVVAVDLVVLERLMAFTGPKTLDAPGFGPVTFTPANVILELERVTRPAFVPATDDRKSLIGELASLIIADLLDLPSAQWAGALRAVRDLGEERHVQLLSYRAEEQTVIRDIRWDGRMEVPPGDYLQFNEASLHSTKLNLIIKPEGAYTISLDAFGVASHELTLTYHNPLPEWSKDKDADLVARLMEGGLYGGYLRIFGPLGISSFQVTVDNAPASVEDLGVDGAKRWFGTYMPLPSGATQVATFRWTSPSTVSGPEGEYQLYIQKQPGTEGLCLDFKVARDGRQATGVEISGGDRDSRGRICLTSDVTVRARFPAGP